MAAIDSGFEDLLLQAVGKGRTMLLPLLLAAQRAAGYVSPASIEEIHRALGVPLAEIQGVIDFYSMLYSEPTAQSILRICISPTCSAQGGHALLKETLTALGVEAHQATPDGKFFVEPVQCLGLCDHAPAALVGDQRFARATAGSLLAGQDGLRTRIYGSPRILTERIHQVAPTDLQGYLQAGGMNGLQRALGCEPGALRAEIGETSLLGRGGAAFATQVKWDGAAGAQGEPKYIVCNADESEPGTFKDRVLLEYDPFAVLEGMIIGGYSIGARQGVIYIRGEYQIAHRYVAEVIGKLRAAGYLGTNLLSSGFDFDIELRSGAGAYICGEETALFESIEGKRGFPRLKPPYPTTHGLFQKPTVINNVETFANVTLIQRIGVERYNQLGSAGSKGPWLFCVSGDVARPGLYEVTTPTSLHDLIFEQAGGMPDQDCQAVLLGGAAGKFVRPDQIGVMLTQEGTRQLGLSLGSGAVIVIGSQRNLAQMMVDLGHFFAHESCGKCYPCQLGTQRQSEILERVRAGSIIAGDRERLLDVGWTMTDASICGLGQTAASAVMSALELWPELFLASKGEAE